MSGHTFVFLTLRNDKTIQLSNIFLEIFWDVQEIKKKNEIAYSHHYYKKMENSYSVVQELEIYFSQASLS